MHVRRWIVAGVCALSALMGVGNVLVTHAATLTVCAGGCQYTQVQPALDAAASGDTITVGPGTYTGGFTISKSVTVIGAGTTATAILGGGPVVTIAAGVTVAMSNLSIGAGGIFREGSAGGIYDWGRLTLRNVKVALNTGVQGGGIFVERSATLTGTAVTIEGNSAQVGGGIINYGSVSLTDSTISGNMAARVGGGIVNGGFETSLSLVNTLVTGNTPNDCINCPVAAAGPGTPPGLRATSFVLPGPSGPSFGFVVAFPSRLADQSYVFFGPGPGCAGLVGTATRDVGAGTTRHFVIVTGDEMNLATGGILPGATYHFEVETVSRSGVEIDNNGGKCYSVTIPSS